MKSLCLVLLLSGLNLFAQSGRFYLGTYPGGDGAGIYTGTLDLHSGKLAEIKLLPGKFQPFLALSHDGKYLYANAAGTNAEVMAYCVEKNGSLTSLNHLPSGNGSCHVSADGTGQNIFVANYAGGDVGCFRTETNGALNPSVVSFLKFKGSGPNPQRQDHPYLHFACVDSANRHLYACDLGTDNVWIFNLDAASGKLTRANPPSAKVPPGSGPRHLAFSPDEKFVYVNGEMGLNVTAFARDPASGALDVIQTLPTLPPSATTNDMATAEIHCHPGGKWLYVSNRDTAHQGRDSLSVFAIGRDGKLSWLQNTPSHVDISRGFAIDPSGSWLLVGGQADNTIAVHGINPVTGELVFTGETAKVGSPVCVIFAPLEK